MAKPANRPATYEDLFGIPDNLIGEIFDGELITQPRPAPKHARAASAIGAILFNNFDYKPRGDDGGWWILYEPECHLASDIVVPDIAGWRESTMHSLPETAWFGIRPDWVCEVISPATGKYDRGVKREIYAREGVGYYWIVDPIERFVEVFVLQRGSWVLSETGFDQQLVNLVPFEALPFDLSVLWA